MTLHSDTRKPNKSPLVLSTSGKRTLASLFGKNFISTTVGKLPLPSRVIMYCHVFSSVFSVLENFFTMFFTVFPSLVVKTRFSPSNENLFPAEKVSGKYGLSARLSLSKLKLCPLTTLRFNEDGSFSANAGVANRIAVR